MKYFISRASITAALAALLLSTACGGCGNNGDPGDDCNIDDPDACVEGLVCAADSEGNDICQIPVGESCTPTDDDEEDFCQADSECVEVEDEEGNTEGQCLVPRAGVCEEDSDCQDGLVCADTTSGDTQCFADVVLRGTVFDSETTDAIEGARVIALDDESTAVSDVAISDGDGSYQLSVPVERDEEGAPTDEIFTLRASAQDYQTFPGGIRTALPVEANTAEQEEDGPWVIQNPVTDIALIILPDDQRGLPSIVGEVISEVREDGVLVVAEAGGVGYSAVTDLGGQFVIFNVPDGSYEVAGYAADVQLVPENVDISGETVEGVELVDSDDGLVTVDGQISLVNGGQPTSIVLVVESTFNENFARGEVPSGLRAPRTGPPSISGAWSIEGVPAGEYVVLAAFENDESVRDPDTGIGGTEIQTITVPAGGDNVTVDTSFKVTEALDVISPGMDAPEGVPSAPTLTWEDDSSEKFYQVRVYNAYGDEVWTDLMVPSVSGGGEVSVMYGGPFEDGMYYQFRATSFREPGGMATPISTTEDLRGVFYKSE